MKRALIFLLSLLVPVGILITSFITFVPADGFSKFCWFVLLPALILFFFSCYHFGYGRTFIKMKAKFSRSSNILVRGFLQVYFYFFLAVFAGINVFAFMQLTAVPTYYFARNSYSENVLVKKIVCHAQGSQAGIETNITFVSLQNYQHYIRVNQDLCLQNPAITDLAGQNITLYGRQGFFGATIDGFQYNQSNRISIKNNMPSLQAKSLNPASSSPLGDFLRFFVLAAVATFFAIRNRARRR